MCQAMYLDETRRGKRWMATWVANSMPKLRAAQNAFGHELGIAGNGWMRLVSGRCIHVCGMSRWLSRYVSGFVSESAFGWVG